jgi:cell division protein FtsL
MKRWQLVVLVVTLPLFLIGAVWQTNRYAALAADARRVEAAQEEWIDENEKLVGSIAVLSSRERIAALAAQLGLKKATPDRRIHIVPQKAAPTKGGPNG